MFLLHHKAVRTNTLSEIDLRLYPWCSHFMQCYHFYCHPLRGADPALYLCAVLDLNYSMFGLVYVSPLLSRDYKKAKIHNLQFFYISIKYVHTKNEYSIYKYLPLSRQTVFVKQGF